ncbi:hypothetical protein BP6252_12396 [Coleophoma cylindrospora]|uniref:DUF7962 domain-containing protein n=1 Tax=Coleophoma cylindrospora TaxID=1849047 RepID=A0A3D8QGQ3_9HELO|nr:hypothetical protein BP6252_12396 [Coleophoma cylindrospora]
MPRPDVASLGVQYRRIPLLAIGRDIYTDTRLILSKLETLFPPSSKHPRISAAASDQAAVEKLLEAWVVDGGVFLRASQLIPTSMPLYKDEKFTKDRAQFSGKAWSLENVERMRPEALVEIRRAFTLLETTLLADGREWILNTDGPSLADIEAVWPFHWLKSLKGALPPSLISPTQFPKVFSWIDRFHGAISAAAQKAGKPQSLKGPDARAKINSSAFAEPEGSVDEDDPTGLKKDDLVEVWPIDSGFGYKDRGALAKLSGSEIVVRAETMEGTEVRIHTPRHGFRIRGIGNSKL